MIAHHSSGRQVRVRCLGEGRKSLAQGKRWNQENEFAQGTVETQMLGAEPGEYW